MSNSLNFNQMLDLCWKTAVGVSYQAKLYQASSPKNLSFIHCIFRGNAEYATIMVNCTSEGKVNVVTVDSPYLDDCVIHPPIKMTQEESEIILNNAGYTKWTAVVLREPLYSVKYPPLYIYTVINTPEQPGGYIAVDTTTGDVFPLMG
jgi:hypothetical protein